MKCPCQGRRNSSVGAMLLPALSSLPLVDALMGTTQGEFAGCLGQRPPLLSVVEYQCICS